jgi:enoyl-CoA hydratase/carnithine racemase
VEKSDARALLIRAEGRVFTGGADVHGFEGLDSERGAVGLTPGWGRTQRMAERAGVARAREFVMSGELYDAATLESWDRR